MKQTSFSVVLAAAGLALEFAAVVYSMTVEGGHVRWDRLFVGAATDIVLGALTMLLGAAVVAKLASISFGEFGPAAIKLLAVYLFPVGVGTLIGVLTSGILGWILAGIVLVVMFRWLFDLTGIEITVCVVMTAVARIVSLVGMAVVLGSLF